MNKKNIFKYLRYICGGGALIIVILQQKNPQVYRGLAATILVIAGFGFSLIDAKVNHRRLNPLYHPDRKIHIRNWVILISSLVLTLVLVGGGYVLFFASANGIRR
jgi:hypothetical protein